MFGTMAVYGCAGCLAQKLMPSEAEPTLWSLAEVEFSASETA